MKVNIHGYEVKCTPQEFNEFLKIINKNNSEITIKPVTCGSTLKVDMNQYKCINCCSSTINICDIVSKICDKLENVNIKSKN